MTDENPINVWCRKTNEYLKYLESDHMIHDCFFSDAIQDHDSGDEDPNAWS